MKNHRKVYQKYTSEEKMSNTQKTFTLTKKIARHGNQSAILIPKFLQHALKPKTIVEVKISIVKEAENENI